MGCREGHRRYMMSRSEESPSVKLPKRWMFSHQSEEGHSRRKSQERPKFRARRVRCSGESVPGAGPDIATGLEHVIRVREAGEGKAL